MSARALFIFLIKSIMQSMGMRGSQDLSGLAKPKFQPVECLMLV